MEMNVVHEHASLHLNSKKRVSVAAVAVVTKALMPNLSVASEGAAPEPHGSCFDLPACAD